MNIGCVSGSNTIMVVSRFWAGVFVAAALWASLGCDRASVGRTDSSQNAGSGAFGGTSAAGGTTGQNPKPSVPDGGGIALPDGSASPTADAPLDAGGMCAEETFQAEMTPLDLLLVVDTSGSMLSPTVPGGTKLKWEAMAKSLMGFVRDPRSAGLGMGLVFFPVNKTCARDSDCPALMTQFGSFMSCQERRVCWGPAGVSSPGRQCDGDGGYLCPPGSTCQPVGTCSLSGADCPNLGQPCAANEGMCTAVTSTCIDLPPNDICAVAAYGKPTVPIGTLPATEPVLLRSLADRYPTGGTPLGPAVEGALAYLRTHTSANPGRKTAMIIATDGTPSGCAASNAVPAIADLLGAANRGALTIATYVVGVFASYEVAEAEPQLNRLATAGGTGKAFILTATEDLPMKLQAALTAIRGAALACEFKIPAPKTGTIDFRKVNVRYTPSASSAPRDEIPYVGSVDRCDAARGGWYYDVDPAKGNPAAIKICESSCGRFQNDARGRVDLLFGCATQTID